MAALAEAYIHLKPYRLDDGNIDRIAGELEALAKKVAQRLYDRPIDLELQIEEGSLKAWLTILGIAVGGAYNGIAVYPDFKNGMHELVQDAREFGGQVIQKFLEQEEVKPHQVYRTERRLMTPGKIYRLITRIEETQNRLPILTDDQTHNALESIKADLQRIQFELDSDEEMATILKVIPRDKLPQLPKTPHEVKELKVALRPKELMGVSSITDHGSGYLINPVTPGYPALTAVAKERYLSLPDDGASRLSRHKTVVVIPKPNDNPPGLPEERQSVPLLRK